MNSGSFVNASRAVNIGSIFIDKPIMLLIVALPLVVLFTITFALVTRKDNVNGHSIASYVMHIALALVIGLAAAHTSWVTTLTETHVFVVADVSYSANKNLSEIDDIIHNRLILPRNTKVSVVCFGKDYELLCESVDQDEVPSVTKSKVDDSETNIAEALSYAGSLFKGDVIKKIVLITDAKQTDDSDAYAVRRAIDTLSSLDIEVNAIYIDDNYDPGTPEVQISGAEFTKSAFINHEEWARVTVQASYATRAVMTLSSGDVTLQERLVDLTEGDNIVSFALDTSTGGTYDYTVTVSASNDTSEYNNSYHFTQRVSSDIKVLIVSGDWKTLTTLVDMYADTATIDAFENDMRTTASTKARYWAGINSDKIHGYNCNPSVLANYKDVPYMVEELCKYDEIIMSEIDITTLPNNEEMIRNLDTAISLFGKSLITVGNVYVQDKNLDTYNAAKKSILSALDDMLPVRYGQSSDDPKLYTLVLDASRSMSDMTPSRLAMEKRIASNVLTALNDSDEVCVVVFYGTSYVMQMPTSLAKRDAIVDSINNLEGIQGTVIGGGLNTAYEVINGLDGYTEKQVMLISDFLDSNNDMDPASDAARYFNDYDIVTSCVNVNRSSSSAVNLANSIAAAGGGKAFHLNSNSDDLGQIKFDELVGREKEKMPSGDFSVHPARPNDGVLSGIDSTAMPTVGKFIYGTNKASTVSVLQLNYQKTGSSVISQVPLYSYWTYGNGTVSSFATAVTAGWSDNWQQGTMQAFLDNVLYTNTPAQKADYPYVLDVRQEESYTRVQIIPADLHFGTTASIKLTKPDGEVVEQELDFDTYYYYYEFRSSEVGKYKIDVNYKYNNVDYSASTEVNVSYSAEYDAFASFDPGMLFKAVDGRGTVITEGTLTVINNDEDVGTYTVDFTYALLIIAVALYVVDIAVRKLKWEDIVSFFGGNKKAKQVSGEGKAQ